MSTNRHTPHVPAKRQCAFVASASRRASGSMPLAASTQADTQRDRLQGAGVRVPVRRQRRQQHDHADRHRRLRAVLARCAPAASGIQLAQSDRCCRSSRSTAARRSGCIQPSSELQTLFNQKQGGDPRQRRHATQPTTQGAVQRRRAAAVAVFAFGPAGTVAELRSRRRIAAPDGAGASPTRWRR